jgi:uncharacterized Zn finger protein (UPF0148 family)
MTKKTECPVCGAPLPILKGEMFSCPECGMPLESSDSYLNEEPLDEETDEEEE